MRKIVIATVVGLLCGLLPVSLSAQGRLSAFIELLKFDADAEQLLKGMKGYGLDEVAVFEQQQRQSLRKGLLDSKLLETLNHFELAPKDESGQLDRAAFLKFYSAKKDGRHYTLAFDLPRQTKSDRAQKYRLRYVLLRIAVPVDSSRDGEHGWSKKRLSPVKDVLLGLADFGLQPVEKDSYQNVFAWRGKYSTAEMRIWYLPEVDELRILLCRR